MSHSTLRHFGKLIMPTRKDGSVLATPRRLRLVNGETLDHWMGDPFTCRVQGQLVQVRRGDYVGPSNVLSHQYIMTNSHLWSTVREPFTLAKD